MKKQEVTLTNAKMNGVLFVLEKMVSEHPNLHVKMWYPIKQTMLALQPLVNVYRESNQHIVNKYCKRDADNNLLIDKNNYVFESDEDKEQANKEFAEVGEISEKVTLYMFSLEDLMYFGERFYTDWNSLEPIIWLEGEDPAL